MSDFDNFDFGALERRKKRELDEVEQRRAARVDARREHLRRVHRRRRAAVGALLTLLVAGLAGAWTVFGGSSRSPSSRPDAVAAPSTTTKATTRTIPAHVAMPAQVRAVHVGLGAMDDLSRFWKLAGPNGKRLNALQIDIKDENGEVGFTANVPALAHKSKAARSYYDAKEVVRQAHGRDIYVIGRIVSFKDPAIAKARPDLAVHTQSGEVWFDGSGNWLNHYDPRVWNYLIGLAKAGAKAGMDEIQFDYVRFPSEGDPQTTAVWPNAKKEAYSSTIERFVAKARKELKPYGVKLSLDVFGLAATHELGIGQDIEKLAKHVDVVTPMAYPSHYASGEFNIPDPAHTPYDTVAFTMGDFRAAVRGSGAQIRPFLQDFYEYSPEDVKLQVRAAVEGGAKGWLLWNPLSEYTPSGVNERSTDFAPAE